VTASRKKTANQKAKPEQSTTGPRALMVRLRAKPLLLAIALLVTAIGCGAGALIIYMTGSEKSVTASLDRFYRNAATQLGLTVDDVLVTGRVQTPRKKLLKALHIRRGDPILGFDPHDARARLLEIGWIAEADVERRLPGTIFIRITEQKPAAIWQHNGHFKLISRDGAIISSKIDKRYKDLKILVGADAREHAADLLAILESEPSLIGMVTHATRVGSRRWNLVLKQGVDVRLPAKNPAHAWKRLAKLQRQHNLLRKRIRTVDLRIPDRMIVRLLRKPGAVQAGEET
jgi:cell division protein FtsQ